MSSSVSLWCTDANTPQYSRRKTILVRCVELDYCTLVAHFIDGQLARRPKLAPTRHNIRYVWTILQSQHSSIFIKYICQNVWVGKWWGKSEREGSFPRGYLDRADGATNLMPFFYG